MASAIQVRVDDDLKAKSDEFERVSANPYDALTEHELLEKLEKSLEHAAQGMYRNATEVSCDMRAKYGL